MASGNRGADGNSTAACDPAASNNSTIYFIIPMALMGIILLSCLLCCCWFFFPPRNVSLNLGPVTLHLDWRKLREEKPEAPEAKREEDSSSNPLDVLSAESPGAKRRWPGDSPMARQMSSPTKDAMLDFHNAIIGAADISPSPMMSPNKMGSFNVQQGALSAGHGQPARHWDPTVGFGNGMTMSVPVFEDCDSGDDSQPVTSEYLCNLDALRKPPNLATASLQPRHSRGGEWSPHLMSSLHHSLDDDAMMLEAPSSVQATSPSRGAPSPLRQMAASPVHQRRKCQGAELSPQQMSSLRNSLDDDAMIFDAPTSVQAASPPQGAVSPVNQIDVQPVHQRRMFKGAELSPQQMSSLRNSLDDDAMMMDGNPRSSPTQGARLTLKQLETLELQHTPRGLLAMPLDEFDDSGSLSGDAPELASPTSHSLKLHIPDTRLQNPLCSPRPQDVNGQRPSSSSSLGGPKAQVEPMAPTWMSDAGYDSDHSAVILDPSERTSSRCPSEASNGRPKNLQTPAAEVDQDDDAPLSNVSEAGLAADVMSALSDDSEDHSVMLMSPAHDAVLPQGSTSQ